MINSTQDSPAEVRAYQRGWNEAQDWRIPHLNPYPVKSPEWWAWGQGYDEGRPHIHYGSLHHA